MWFKKKSLEKLTLPFTWWVTVCCCIGMFLVGYKMFRCVSSDKNSSNERQRGKTQGSRLSQNTTFLLWWLKVPLDSMTEEPFHHSKWAFILYHKRAFTRAFLLSRKSAFIDQVIYWSDIIWSLDMLTSTQHRQKIDTLLMPCCRLSG